MFSRKRIIKDGIFQTYLGFSSSILIDLGLFDCDFLVFRKISEIFWFRSYSLYSSSGKVNKVGLIMVACW
jgi:hypothetical protein